MSDELPRYFISVDFYRIGLDKFAFGIIHADIDNNKLPDIARKFVEMQCEKADIRTDDLTIKVNAFNRVDSQYHNLKSGMIVKECCFEYAVYILSGWAKVIKQQNKAIRRKNKLIKRLRSEIAELKAQETTNDQ